MPEMPAEPAVAAAALARAHPALLARLHRFAHLPSASLHESWLDALPAASPLLRRGGLDAGAHRWISEWLAAELALAPHPTAELRAEHAFALLEPGALEALAAHAGAAWLAPLLGATLPGEVARAQRDAFGPELAAFALERAPLLVSEAEREAGGIPSDAAATPLEAGVGLLRAACGETDGLWARVRLKLRRDAALSGWTPALAQACAQRVVTRILRQLEPAWLSSFARALAR